VEEAEKNCFSVIGSPVQVFRVGTAKYGEKICWYIRSVHRGLKSTSLTCKAGMLATSSLCWMKLVDLMLR